MILITRWVAVPSEKKFIRANAIWNFSSEFESTTVSHYFAFLSSFFFFWSCMLIGWYSVGKVCHHRLLTSAAKKCQDLVSDMCQIIYTNLLNRNIESVQLLDSAEMKPVVILSLLAKMIMDRVLRLFWIIQNNGLNVKDYGQIGNWFAEYDKKW